MYYETYSNDNDMIILIMISIIKTILNRKKNVIKQRD